MNHQIVKIYNTQDFKHITKGIKVAQCMRLNCSSIADVNPIISNLEGLAISESLCCSCCNAVFENKIQQRLHYKLDWHRFNLKQRLHGYKSVSEDSFKLLTEENDIANISSSEKDSISEEDTVISDISSSQVRHVRKRITKFNKRLKILELKSDSSDGEYVEEDSGTNKNDILFSVASRHSKVFFENEEGKIFSIYRCLLHNKKEVPEDDNKIIHQALQTGKKSLWTVIMIGGGHFAAAVFSDGTPLVHKTFHNYTVRAKQGSAQSSRDNRNSSNHPKSAGANFRRHCEVTLTQHIQEILESWSSHLINSSLILYRAVGPYNRMMLFGGRNAPLDKNDPRLRPLPFPTRRATFSEVKRVYDILSNMEIYGPAADFIDSFPISPRQPPRKKALKTVSVNNLIINRINIQYSSAYVKKQKNLRKYNKNSRTKIDRAKPRKSPERPLPDIVAKLAQSSSESELDIQDNREAVESNMNFIEHNLEIGFGRHLSKFENTAQGYLKKRNCQYKRYHEKNQIKI